MEFQLCKSKTLFMHGVVANDAWYGILVAQVSFCSNSTPCNVIMLECLQSNTVTLQDQKPANDAKVHAYSQFQANVGLSIQIVVHGWLTAKLITSRGAGVLTKTLHIESLTELHSKIICKERIYS